MLTDHTAARWSITASSRSTSTARSSRCAPACAVPARRLLRRARRWRPARSRCASCPEAYDIQTLHIMSQGLFTNTSQAGPYRGAGRPEAAYFIERLIEQAARQIGIEPAEIRRRNLIPPAKLPYTTPTFWTYDTGEFQRLMDKCIELSDWKGYRGAQEGLGEERQAARPRGELLHRVRRHLQRPHGPALRSRRRAHGPRRHAFARPGPRDGVRAARARMARRAVRDHPLRAGRHRAGRDRPRHLCGAQRHGRRQCADGGRRRDHREGQADGRRA